MPECDCCGEDRELTQTWAPGGLETWACDECRGAPPLAAAFDRFQAAAAALEFTADTAALDAALAKVDILLLRMRQEIDTIWAAQRAKTQRAKPAKPSPFGRHEQTLRDLGLLP